jgi:hypothetical protein
LLGVIVTIWILASAAYLLLREWTGFYFMQLVFVPLVSGLIILYNNKILGIITLSFWFTIIYGVINLPYRDIVTFIPILLLLAYFIRFALKVKDTFFKIMGWTFSALSILVFVRALKIQGMFDTDIIQAVGLFVFPIIIFYKSLQVLRPQKTMGIVVMIMAIIVFAQLLTRLFNILALFDMPSLLDNSLIIIMILSLGIAAFMTRNKSDYLNINSVTLAYFVFVLFKYFAWWILDMINRQIQ